MKHTDFDHLIATKQYFPAVWRLIDDDDIGETETLRRVSEVVGLAIKTDCHEQVSKIMRQFSKWVNDDMSAAAYTYLNEKTGVEPVTDLDEADIVHT